MSDRTIQTIEDVTILSTGGVESVKFKVDASNGGSFESSMQLSRIKVQVNRSLRGPAIEDFWLADSVLPSGESLYGNLVDRKSGVFFIRQFQNIQLAVLDGYFAHTSKDVVANNYMYSGGIALDELERTLAATQVGTACPHDATTPRYDQQGIAPHSASTTPTDAGASLRDSGLP